MIVTIGSNELGACLDITSFLTKYATRKKYSRTRYRAIFQVDYQVAVECAACGFSNPDQALFCAGCGMGVAIIKCQHCNTEIPPGPRFCHACGSSLAIGEGQKSQQSRYAERRVITVLFCDLVGSTVLVDDLDPELSRRIIRGFQALCKDTIQQFGGRISTFLGDGIVALFSHRETNAECAINTALQITRRLEQSGDHFSQAEYRVEVRCGIATGLAVVGDYVLGHSSMRARLPSVYR